MTAPTAHGPTAPAVHGPAAPADRPDTLTIHRPDDWHLHLRDGAAMRSVLPFTAQRFARAIVMPNLKPPLTTTRAALAYRERIIEALPPGARFEPLMTLYLTNQTTPAEIQSAKDSQLIHGVKLYPAGATTHSDAGVSDFAAIYPALDRMQTLGMPLLIHGEVTDPAVDVFDREVRFIDTVLAPLVERLPELKVVFEHITTARAVEFVLSVRRGIAATITPQHLLHNRNAIFEGGIRPHYYCLPVLKRERDRVALTRAATSGNPKFFLGTDSAPHARDAKEASCGCAGIFTAHAAIELYAEVFDSQHKIDKLEGFASHFGSDFYGLERNVGTLTLKRESWSAPATYPFGTSQLVPYRAGETIAWRLVPEGAP